MIDPSALQQQTCHSHFAGRTPAGTSQPVTLAKNGVRHMRWMPASDQKKEILSIGLACSECFSGPRLAKVLTRGFEHERRVMLDMMAGKMAGSLSVHTSSGVPLELNEFVEAMANHLPWTNSNDLDWCLSLQLEGASAVWAAIDMLLQEQILSTGNKHRKMVAVGSTSYHGPPSTSFGSRSPIWHKSYQVKYPVPQVGTVVDEAKLLGEFEAFLNKHSDDIGVLLVEPQWGSSQAGFPWPRQLLRTYIKMAQARGIRVLADEIMCGLGRHGQGTLFLSKAWDLDPDAVTFGKAIAGGVFPLSGAIVKRGRDVLCKNGRSVMQSHTLAGSSSRALLTGTEVLRELPQWFDSISKLGDEMGHVFRHLVCISDGMLIAQGQGLMWGCLFAKEGANSEEDNRLDTVSCFQKHCEDVGVLPYFVPVGGFMVTPVVDIDVGTVYEIGEKLEEALLRTMKERNWRVPFIKKKEEEEEQRCFVKKDITMMMEGDGGVPTTCLANLHTARSCSASCASFVCRNKRMRFMET